MNKRMNMLPQKMGFKYFNTSFIEFFTVSLTTASQTPQKSRYKQKIVYILLGISLASNCSWPTFRNPVSVPSSKAGCRQCEECGFLDAKFLEATYM